MAATIKQISELCGVSRGTVDRVLNNRGRVKPETEEKVRRVAKELGYIPNLAGKALAARKKEFMIGVALTGEGVDFFDDVILGFRRAEEELRDYGVKFCLRTIRGYDAERQIALIDEMKDQVSALILNPINDPQVAEKIDDLVKNGICVVTVNNDIENTQRLCYVGCDYIRSGETACGLLGLLTGGRAKIGIVTGSVKILGHNQRIQGFQNIRKVKFPQFDILDIREANDDDEQAFQVTSEMLAEYPEMDAVFIAAAGSGGVCRAVRDAGRLGKVTVICYDCTPNTEKLLKSGEIKATICQQPFTQGNRSARLAFNYLVSGQKPEREHYFVKNEIKIQENL